MLHLFSPQEKEERLELLPSEEELDEEMKRIEEEARLLVEQKEDTPQVMERLKLRFQGLLLLSTRVTSEE